MSTNGVDATSENAPQQNRFRSTLLFYLCFFVTWTIRVYVLLPYDSNLQPRTLNIAVGTIIRIVLWLVPLIIYLRATTHAPLLHYLKITTPVQWRRAGIAVLVVAAYLTAGMVLYAANGGHLINVQHMTARDWLLAVFDVVDAPIIEEIFFRGFLLTRFAESMRFWKAAILSSLLFMLIHWPGWIYASGIQAGLIVTSAQVFLFGVVLSYLTKASNSILPGIVAHLINNLLLWS